MCTFNYVSHDLYFYIPTQCHASASRLRLRTTAGQEDPFELDSNLLLSSGRHGEDRKRQYIHLYDHETPLLDDLADLLY